MAAKLGTLNEYVHLWDKLVEPVVFNSLCEAVGRSALVKLMVRITCFSVLLLVSQYNQLNCEERNLK